MKPVLILTRPETEAVEFAQDVEAMLQTPVQWIHSPAFRIEPIDADLPAQGDWLIFTSANGVQRAQQMGLRPQRAYCVGDRTADLAARAGFEARSANGDADALVALLLQDRPAGTGVHISGQETRGDVVARLRSAGLSAMRHVAYRQVLLPPNDTLIAAAANTNPVVAPVFSSRSALHLLDIDWQGISYGIAMSPAVAESMSAARFDQLIVVAKPTWEAMLEGTCAALRALMDR